MTSAILSQIDGNVLAVDTSTASGSLAIAEFKNGQSKILGQTHWQKKAMHSEVATLELTRLLQQSQMSLQDISHFAVNIGPGSFTGLRVGINLVRALAYALNKPVAQFTSLEVMAFLNAQEGETVLVALKAIQNFFYAGVYQKQNGLIGTLVEPQSTTLEEVPRLAQGCGTIIEGNGPALSFDAGNLLQMTATASFFSWNDVKPLYVRGSEAEEKLGKGFLKPL